MKDLILRLARALNRLAETDPDETTELETAKAEARRAIDELSAYKATTQAEKDAQKLSPTEQAEVDKALGSIADAAPAE